MKNSKKGVAQAYLSARLSTKTVAQQGALSEGARDEVAEIRRTVLLESISMTEGQARSWGQYLANLDPNEDIEEHDATREILMRVALPITALVALRNHWRFASPAEAMSAFWSESRNAVKRWDTSKGRLRFTSFMESTLGMRAEAVAEEQQGDRKLQERLDSLQNWIDDLGLSVGVTAEELFEAIKARCEEEGTPLKSEYFHTLLRVRNTLEVLQTRGHTVLSLDHQEEEGESSLKDTLATDEQEAERQRNLAALGPVVRELEDEGLLEEALALPEGHLQSLLEAAVQGPQWLNAAACVLGVKLDFAERVSRKLTAFYKSA